MSKIKPKECQNVEFKTSWNDKVENFCGGVRVTIQRTKFMQMMNITSDVGSNVGSFVGS